MSKELKIKGALGNDFQQIYIDDEPTNLFINKEGRIKTATIKDSADGSQVEISGDNLSVPTNVKAKDGDHLNLSSGGDVKLTSESTGRSVQFFNTDNLKAAVSNKGFLVEGSFYKREAAVPGANIIAYGQIWVKNSTPNELYFTTDAGDDIQLTSGTSVAGGGGGTQTWSKTVGGYKTNNNSSSFYYMQTYPNYHSWSSSDSSPTTLSYVNTSKASTWHANKDGTLTNMRITLRAGDTGLTDPLKFYVYKGTVANDTSSTYLTLIGTSSTITPISGRTMVVSDDFSSSNDFDEGDSLFIMLKKDSTTGNQDVYFQVTISGEYD